LSLVSPSKKGNKGKLVTITEVFLFPRCPQMRRNYVGEGIPLFLAFLPLPPVAKVLEDFFRVQPPPPPSPQKAFLIYLF
jgi:hypothetical protein